MQKPIKMQSSNCNAEILRLLEKKSSTKQKVYRKSGEVFSDLKGQLKIISSGLEESIEKIDSNVKVVFKDKSVFEAQIIFSGDVLHFNHHSNVFTFDKGHPLWKSNYIRQDKKRAYFGMINIYNFLADSFKYNRANDVGVLLGRIFVNCEGHFFVEGRRQLGFLYRDVTKDVLDKEKLRNIIETSMIYALNFDLTVPEFKDSMLVSVKQLETLNNEQQIRTSKSLGFRFHTNMQKID